MSYIDQITVGSATYDIYSKQVNGHTVATDVPANAVFTDTTYTPASATPLMDGSGVVGTSSKYAREDHRHPYDTMNYRKGNTAVHKVASPSAEPQHVSLIENKNTLEQLQTIRAISGAGDYFYAAHLNTSEYSIECNYSGQHGTKGNFAISTLFAPSASSTVLLDVDVIAQTPFVLTIQRIANGNITATDVVHLELYTHTLGNSQARLTDYKVELYTTGSTASTGEYSWQTVYERHNVSDSPSGLVIPLNPTQYPYLYFKGIRFTIYGATPGSTSSTAWNYNCLDLSLFRLVDQRPAFTAARGVGALDISGGTVYGQTTFLHGITGTLTGNASTATKATQDESGNNIKSSYGASLGISGSVLTLKNKNSAALSSVTLPTAPVTSVNNKTGTVVLTASDVGALPTTTSIPAAYTATPAALGTASAGSSPSWARGDHVHAKPTYNKSDVGLGNVDNVKQYSASNPPPYPVTSVNGATGAVSISAVPAGGLEGQVLAKSSNGDYAVAWTTIDAGISMSVIDENLIFSNSN